MRHLTSARISRWLVVALAFSLLFSRLGLSRAKDLQVVLHDPEGEPIANAVVVVGLDDTGTPNHQVLKTDGAGRASWPLPPGEHSVFLCVHKEGWAAWPTSVWTGAEQPIRERTLVLTRPGRHTAALVDDTGKPVAEATVRLEMSARLDVKNSSIGFFYFRRNVLAGSPLEPLFTTRTNERGAFSFDNCLPPGASLRLAVVTADGRHMRLKPRAVAGGMAMNPQGMGFVSVPEVPGTTFTLIPAARVQGRISTKLPGVKVENLKVWYQSSRASASQSMFGTNFGATVATDAQGRFVFDDLNEDNINVFVNEPDRDAPWTYRAAQDIELKPGWTKAVLIELIEGVQVEGTVVSRGEPLNGVQLGMYGPNRPRSGAATRGATTDAQGRYRYRLPPGKTLFYVMGSMGDPPNQSQTVTIPEGATHFQVPPIEITATVVAGGRVLDVAGHPVAGAQVTGIIVSGRVTPFQSTAILTDARGAFTFPPNTAIPSRPGTRFRVQLAAGAIQDVAPTPGFVESVTLTLPK